MKLPFLFLAVTCSAIATADPSPLRVVGNQLRDSKGQIVRLEGVNIPSLEWSAEGERVAQSINQAMGNWNAKIIRVPLSQDLWFGYPRGKVGEVSKQSPDRGAAYRMRIDSVVKQISTRGGYVLLDLHWSDGGKWGQFVGQHCMPDENSVVFWRDFAKRYANHPAVLFDLYNEPHDVSWEIWQKGGIVEERNGDPSRGAYLKYRTPGMQALLGTIRATGAKNVVVAGGLDWAYDLRGVVSGFALSDKSGRGIMYGTHIYPWKKNWDVNVTPVIAKHPVFVGEIGCKPWKPGEPEHEKGVDCATWAPEAMAYLAKYRLNWTAWSFHPSASPCLITGWDYQPTAYWGAYVKRALAAPTSSAPKKKISKGKTQ